MHDDDPTNGSTSRRHPTCLLCMLCTYVMRCVAMRSTRRVYVCSVNAIKTMFGAISMLLNTGNAFSMLFALLGVENRPRMLTNLIGHLILI